MFDPVAIQVGQQLIRVRKLRSVKVFEPPFVESGDVTLRVGTSTSQP